MTSFFSPDVVLAVIAIASFAIALCATAVMLAIRASRRRAARHALAAIRVPAAETVLNGEPYRALKDGLTTAATTAKAARR